MNYLSDGGSSVRLYKYKNKLLPAFLAVGFLAGMLYENLISRSRGMSIELWESGFLTRYLQTEIVAEEYLWYVIKLRVLPLLGLCILGTFRWRKIIVAAGLLWTGFLTGILTVSAVMQLGIKGILFCIVALFPHMVFYGMAYGIILLYLYHYPRKQWNVSKTVFVILMLFLGVVLETYVNPFLMRWVLKMI